MHYIYSHTFLLPDIFSKQTSLSIFICFYQTFQVDPAAVDNYSSLLGVKYGERKIIMYPSKFKTKHLSGQNVHLYGINEGQKSEIISIDTLK